MEGDPNTMKRRTNPLRYQVFAITALAFVFSPLLHADDSELPKEVQELNESYAREIERVLPPIQEKYIEALERILEYYTKAGSLDEAIRTKKQIEQARRWQTIPLERFRTEEFKNLSRSEFED